MPGELVKILEHGSLLISSKDLTDLAEELEDIIKKLEDNSTVSGSELISLRVVLSTLKGRFFGP